MDTNEIQIGGSHYKDYKYQPWDFFIDSEMPYILACAIKYVVRWRNKNGVEDLRKALHYLNKAGEYSFPEYIVDHALFEFVPDFCNQLPLIESAIVELICTNEFDKAVNLIDTLISETITKEIITKGE